MALEEMLKKDVFGPRSSCYDSAQVERMIAPAVELCAVVKTVWIVKVEDVRSMVHGLMGGMVGTAADPLVVDMGLDVIAVERQIREMYMELVWMRCSALHVWTVVIADGKFVSGVEVRSCCLRFGVNLEGI